MKYVITRGKCREWPSHEYTLEEILTRARRDNRVVVDGYDRKNLRGARKLKANDPKMNRAPVILIAIEEEACPRCGAPMADGMCHQCKIKR